jgi:hypothetical protein
MGTQKVYDLAVKVGEYQDRDGKTKGRYQNVGAVLQKDDGGKFMMLERWFNPAGVMNPDGRSTVLLSMFEPRQADGGNAPAPRLSAAPAPMEDLDDVPF